MSKGGARYGAGRMAYRVKADEVRRVDLRLWAQAGYMTGNQWFRWKWSRGGESVGSVAVGVVDRVSVTLTLQGATDRPAPLPQVIRLTATPCHFGGVREWFVCPCCGGRSVVLYERWGRFACRTCQRVAYASQSEDELGRLWRKQLRLEARLGANWRRPKGMRQHTYWRLFKALAECEENRAGALETAILRLFG